MATKKTSKTTKTAHVLNVLSGGQDEAAPGEEDALTEEVAAPKPRAKRTAPILDDAHASDEALVGSIQEALSQELAKESLPGQTPAPLPEAAEETEVVAVPIQDAPPPAAPKPEPEVAPKPAPAKAPAPTDISEPVGEGRHVNSATPLPGDLVYVNIMQALVEEKAEKYIQMFGLCPCSRCQADVKAIALSNLPPKYMVMPKGAFVPMLTVYDRQFGTALTAHIIAACRKVMDDPRH